MCDAYIVSFQVVAMPCFFGEGSNAFKRRNQMMDRKTTLLVAHLKLLFLQYTTPDDKVLPS